MSRLDLESKKLSLYLEKNNIPGSVSVFGISNQEEKSNTRNFSIHMFSEIIFDDMDKISKLFETRKINLCSEIEHGGYCDTCRHTTVTSYLDVTVDRDIYNKALGEVSSD